MACHKVCKYKLQLQTPSNASFTVMVLLALDNAILCYRCVAIDCVFVCVISETNTNMFENLEIFSSSDKMCCNFQLLYMYMAVYVIWTLS